MFDRYRDDISLVITDLIMPEMGGIALGGELHNRGSKTPILYMTGYHQDLEKYPSTQLPLFGGLLLKPFTPQTLAQTIRKTVRPLKPAEIARI